MEATYRLLDLFGLLSRTAEAEDGQLKERVQERAGRSSCGESSGTGLSLPRPSLAAAYLTSRGYDVLADTETTKYICRNYAFIFTDLR